MSFLAWPVRRCALSATDLDQRLVSSLGPHLRSAILIVPSVTFYISQWYRRHEVNFRIAVFFSAATAAGAFGGLLARLIQLMNGKAGLAGWRWICACRI